MRHTLTPVFRHDLSGQGIKFDLEECHDPGADDLR